MIEHIKKRVDCIEGVQMMSLIKHSDNRGWFCQAWTTEELEKIGFRSGFVQLNIAESKRGVLRGMHRQDQAKLVQVVSGRIFDVALNPETGEWCGFELEPGEALLIPSKYAHGYLVLSDSATVQYVVDRPYNQEKEENFSWSKYGIEWPLVTTPILSNKDGK